jgi:hypothetical protein
MVFDVSNFMTINLEIIPQDEDVFVRTLTGTKFADFVDRYIPNGDKVGYWMLRFSFTSASLQLHGSVFKSSKSAPPVHQTNDRIKAISFPTSQV